MSMRIAVGQQKGNPGKPDENRDKALRFAREALDRGSGMSPPFTEPVIAS